MTSRDDYKVYFLHCPEAKLIKIGCSVWPESRIHDLGWMMPGKALIISKMNLGSFRSEKLVHALCSKYHIRREWFNESKYILDLACYLDGKRGLPKRLQNKAEKIFWEKGKGAAFDPENWYRPIKRNLEGFSP